MSEVSHWTCWGSCGMRHVDRPEPNTTPEHAMELLLEHAPLIYGEQDWATWTWQAREYGISHPRVIHFAWRDGTWTFFGPWAPTVGTEMAGDTQVALLLPRRCARSSASLDKNLFEVYFAPPFVRSVVRTQLPIDCSFEAPRASGHASGRVLRVNLRFPGDAGSDLSV